MPTFGLISMKKYVELQDQNEEMRKSLDEALGNLKKSRTKISELSKSLETVSRKNGELADAFHSIVKERDQLEAKLEKYAEERLILQGVIQELDSLAKKRRRKSETQSSNLDSFESEIKRLLDQAPIDRQ